MTTHPPDAQRVVRGRSSPLLRCSRLLVDIVGTVLVLDNVLDDDLVKVVVPIINVDIGIDGTAMGARFAEARVEPLVVIPVGPCGRLPVTPGSAPACRQRRPGGRPSSSFSAAGNPSARQRPSDALPPSQPTTARRTVRSISYGTPDLDTLRAVIGGSVPTDGDGWNALVRPTIVPACAIFFERARHPARAGGRRRQPTGVIDRQVCR